MRIDEDGRCVECGADVTGAGDHAVAWPGDGHWTREPAKVEGVYAQGHPGDTRWMPVEYPKGQCPPGRKAYRWSIPLPAMPPVPEGEGSDDGTS